MEIHEVRYFLALCETLNFSRAAEQCNVTQPALTRAIQKLEGELGGLLFRRERNHTHLTDLGRLVRPHLQQMMEDASAARTTAQSFLRLKDAPLSLGIMCTIGPLRCIGFLAKFRHEHPGIELSLHEGSPGELRQLLHEGGLDVAIMAQPEPFGERFRVQPLYRERFMIAFPPGHRFAVQNAVRVADLGGECYLSRINCEYYDVLSDICRANNVKMLHAYRSEREDWIQTMVMAGMGICFLPEYSPILPGLHTRIVTEPEIYREVSLVTIAGRRFSPAVAAFVRAIRAYSWPGPTPGFMAAA